LYVVYHRVAMNEGLIRTLDNVGQNSATLKSYLAHAGRVHFSLWSGRVLETETEAFFPGVAVALLAGVALARRWRGRGEEPLMVRRVVMLAAIGAAGVVLSLGPATPVYHWLYAVFPPLRGLRAAARFGSLFMLAMALLAGVGAAQIRGPGVIGRHATAVTLALIVLINVEALCAPLRFVRFGGISPLYSLLAAEPGPVVLVEQPFYPPRAIFRNAEYVFNSTAHWRPLMNGYSGHRPESYRKYAAAFWSFPGDRAIQAMRQAGVTHVMVHPHRFKRDVREMLHMMAESPHLERIAVGHNDMALYRLR
jgi:hypothetical protein